MRSYVVKSRHTDEWYELDLSILEEGRSPVPAVPLELIPQPWRDWVADTAATTAAPADYVLQTVLAALAAVCGAGVRVRITPAWSEPLVLWQAAVGEASTGKSASQAPMRRLLGVLEQEQRLHDADRRDLHAEQVRKAGGGDPFVPSQIVVVDDDPETVAEIVSGNPRGVLLWPDEPSAWLGDDCEDGGRALRLKAWTAGAIRVARQRQPGRELASFPVSVLETIRPGRLKAAMLEGEGNLSARFLYAWPAAQPYRALKALEPARDEDALKRLRYLLYLARTPEDPFELQFDERGVKALDGVLADLHAKRLRTEGLEAAWLGKGRAFIARLAGAIELLASIDGPGVRPGAIGREQVEGAAALWLDFFWPHARAVFDNAALSEHKRRVRRAARWLAETRASVVTREDIRRRALGMSANAGDTDQVLYQLDSLGFVRRDNATHGERGRPASRWLVNPALAAPQDDLR